MKKTMTLNLTPIMIELFKTQATVLAYVETVMNDEEKAKFDQEYVSCFRKVISEFVEDNPNFVDNADELINNLKK
jgi:hypothetical protein